MRVVTPWIHSPKFDGLAIIGPPVLVTTIVLIWGERIAQVQNTPLWLWVLLVLGIDVAHVYSSLFRTYFDKEEFRRRRTLYLVVPTVSWIVGVGLYAGFGPKVFWMFIAYFAIYHFVRQQYGFFMLYRRQEPADAWSYRIDQAAIYLATIYPLVYWHTFPRNFQWFSDFEVIHIPSPWPELVCRIAYVGFLSAFLVKECWRAHKVGSFNLGKVALLVATAAAWGTGIILFNGDLTFTLINIVSHGVPYIALVWVYQYRKRQQPKTGSQSFLRFFQAKYIPIYLAALFLLAYLEECVWDWAVWHERADVFGAIHIDLSTWMIALLAPLLTMPQVTHYVLDAFIWRVRKKGHEEVRAVIG